MSVVRAGAGDLAALARLMAASPLLQRYRVRSEVALAELTAALGAGDVILTDADGQGFAWVSLAPRVLGGMAYLRLLLVAEGMQGRGIGARLLDAAERASAEGGARHLYLLATTDNVGARRFYERHGYQYVGDLPGLVWPDLDEALYWKALNSSA